MNQDDLRQFKIGLSLPFATAAELENIADLPDNFEYLELSGELAAEAAWLQKNHPVVQEFTRLDFRNIMPAALSGVLTDQSPVIVHEYKKKLREMFALAAQCGASYVSIDPDWESVFEHEERVEVLNDLLRSTAGDREYYNLTLLIAVRVPGSGALHIQESLKLLNKLSSYRVKLVLDINPHELLKSQIQWQTLLAPFRFEVESVRFCYNSELGNKLLYAHIAAMVEAMQRWHRSIHIYIAPSGRADYTELSGMATQINSGATENEST